MTKKHLLILAIIVVVVFGGLKLFMAEKAAAKNAASILTVTVVLPEQKTISERISVTGTTVPREEIVVVSELSAIKIINVLADVGDSVKGQKLAQLDPATLGHILTQLESDYDSANDEFTRVNAIKNAGAVSKEMVVQKQSARESAKAKRDDALLNVQRTVITAPADGVIFERKASIGAVVNANEPLFRIAGNGEIELEANVPEGELSKLKVGQSAVILLTGNTNPLNGKVRLVTPHVDSATRTAIIRIALDKPANLPIGLFANIDITIRDVSGLLLPVTALQEDTTGMYVWQLDKDNKAVRVPVNIIFRGSDGVIVEGISPTARVIARAGAFIKENERVNVAGDK